MKLWQEALVPLVCLLALGCRANPNIVLLERENRELEDTIYELQGCLDKYQHNLEACQRSNAAMQAKLNGTNGSSAQGPSETTPQREEPGALPRRKSQPAPPVPSEQLQPPQVELPPASSPSGELPEAFRTPAPAPKAGLPPKAGVPPKSSAPSAPAGPALPGTTPPPLPSPTTPSPAAPPSKAGLSTRRDATNNTRVAKISLNPRLTGGYDQDGRGGDDGVTVALQPRDAEGRLCSAPAPVSVVVLDPALPGDAARVARWDLSAAEVASVLRDAKPGEGIRLAMPWPQGRPSHRQLQLFVRYTTDSGQKLQADCPIEIALNSQQAQNWAPALLPGSGESATRMPEPARPMPQNSSESPTVQSGPALERAVSVSATDAAPPTWSPDRR